jgi:hypothetical protein
MLLLVPVYDGRHTPFNFRGDLKDLAKILPEFLDEVPIGSCALVAYTVNKYLAKGNWSLSFNVNWVVVLGIPSNTN